MNARKIYSTSDATPSKFRPEGRIDVAARGNTLIYTATGPFNEELVTSLIEINTPIIQDISSNGPWIDLTIMTASALASPATLARFTAYLDDMAKLELAPLLTGWVMAPDLEGRRVMAPLYARCFSTAGLRFSVFEDLASAEEWVVHELESLAQSTVLQRFLSSRKT